MTTDDPMTPRATAAKLQVSMRTLARYRVSGDGPAWSRLGKRLIRYAVSDVESYLAARKSGPAAV